MRPSSCPKAASLAPDWVEPYYLAGVSLYFVGRFPEADKSLGRRLNSDRVPLGHYS
jgi:hypothetical protein